MGYATLHLIIHPTEITTQPLSSKDPDYADAPENTESMHRYIQSVQCPDRICLLVYCKPFDAYAMGLMSG
jgi:hypothetical protein